MEINGNRSEIFCKVLLCTGDTLDQHLWGGFKDGVGFAFHKCRSCLCNFNKMQQRFDENNFVMRTKHSYERHCLDIANAPNEQVKANLKTTYGINIQSPFCALPTFEATNHCHRILCTLYSKVLLNMKHVWSCCYIFVMVL